MGNGISRK